MGIGFRELLIILVIVLIVFGLGKLPKVMKDLGKGIKEFKDGMSQEQKQLPSQTDSQADGHKDEPNNSDKK